MLKNLSDNLNMLMANARINSNELARQVGIPATTIKRIRNNQHANPTLTTLLPIADYFSVTLSQLIGQEKLSRRDENYSVNTSYKIPLLSWGDCVNYTALKSQKFHEQICTEKSVSEKAFALMVEDDELEFFPKNSILIVEPEKKPVTGDYVIVGNVSSSIASIRKYIIEIDQIYLKSLIAGAGISVLTSEFEVLGSIIQYKMELKSKQM